MLMAFLAGSVGLEPTSLVLETKAQPLYQLPIWLTHCCCDAVCIIHE